MGIVECMVMCGWYRREVLEFLFLAFENDLSWAHVMGLMSTDCVVEIYNDFENTVKKYIKNVITKCDKSHPEK